MGIKKVFKSHLQSVNYVTTKGVNLAFVEGRYLTDKPLEIAELEEEVKSGHPYIYIDPNETQIDTTLQDKIREAQKEAALRVIEEYNSAKSPEELAAAAAEMEKAQQKAIDDAAASGTKLLDGSAAAASIAPATMSAASLLNVTSSAALANMSSQSNQKS